MLPHALRVVHQDGSSHMANCADHFSCKSSLGLTNVLERQVVSTQPQLSMLCGNVAQVALLSPAETGHSTPVGLH